MANLEIEGKNSTFFIPTVNFNNETGLCKIEGESYLENTWEFYDKLTSWLRNYIEQGKPIIFNFKLTYFNTSSSKGILDILFLLRDYKQAGGSVTINWYYPEDDDDNLAEAEDFVADAEVEMNLIAYS